MMMKQRWLFTITVLTVLLFTVAVPTASADPGWWNDSWQYREMVTIDHTNVDSGLENFPVMVKIDSTSDLNFSQVAGSSGEDIRFVASDDSTELKYEIERWDDSNNLAEIWVKIPSISSGSNTEFYMYYGNSEASDGQSVTDVWNSNFKMVQHLQETTQGGGSYDDHLDSTSNDNDGEVTGATMDTAGTIDGADDFDGSGDYVSVSDDNILDLTSELTLEAWVKLDDAGNNQKIVGKLITGSGYLLGVVNGHIYPEITDSGGTEYTFQSGTISSNTWTHLAVTWQTSGNMIGYINGNQVNSISASSNDIGTNNNDLVIGAAPWDPDAFEVNGKIDEVRISNTARSAAWLKAVYYSENDNLLTYENQENYWWNSNWNYRKTLTIDHDKVDSALTNFPTLVKIDSTADLDFSKVEGSSGEDIRFTNTAGTTEYKYEIERWDNSNNLAEIWVKIPSVSPTTDTEFYMYYGNSGASDGQSVTDVWDSNFKMVQHLQETTQGGGSYDDHLDSTSNDNDGEVTGATMDGAGNIDGADDFDGVSDYVSVSDDNILDLTSELTLEAWVKLDDAGNNQKIVGKLITGSGYLLGVGSGKIYPEITDSGGTKYTFQSGTISSNTWTHLAVTWQTSGNMIGYINGNQVNSILASSNDIGTNNNNLIIGAASWNPDLFEVDGKIDEVRISNTARSAAWLKAVYYSENDNLLTYENQENYWWNSDWVYKKKITIDHDKVDSALSDFPTLVKIDSISDLDFSKVEGSSGQDIRFIGTGASPTEYEYEIERWDNSNNLAEIWVKIPSVSSTTNTEFYMYYGNSEASDNQDAESVWDSNYKGVWHLDETSKTDGTYNDHSDSTLNNNDAEAENGVTMDTTGKIDGADDFDGSNDYVDCGNDASLNPTTAITVEAWVNRAGASESKTLETILAKGGNYHLDLFSQKPRFILGNGLRWEMDHDLSAADASFIGEDHCDESGFRVSGVGDVNGDGYDDFIIGARLAGTDDWSDIDAGQTYLILGKSSGWAMDIDLSNADASFWGEDPYDYSGTAAGAGDVNGDGYDDFLIGASNNHDGGGAAGGQTYLILGKSSGWAMDTSLSAADASFWGEDVYDGSGYAVSGVGDVNGDGYDDFIIGAYHNNDGGYAAGQTYLILGKASGWAMDTDLSAADASFWGEDAADYSGGAVSGAGDVNGDGYDDFLIGVSGNNDGGDYAGQTYLILGKSSGWAMDTNLSAADASFWGEDDEDYSGGAVSGAGDVNGDGYDDFIIGARADEDGGNPCAGQTYLILGKSSGWAMDTNLSAADASFWGEDAEDHSGDAVSGAGDVNGDGYDDFIIGAYAAGQTYLILGKASGWSMDTDLSAADASFIGYGACRSVSGAGDVNGDGYDDFIIGAHHNSDGGDRAGQTYLLLSSVDIAGSAAAISDNTWHHVAGTFDGSNVKIYVDGVLKDTDARTDNIVSTTADLNIGIFRDCVNKEFKGKLDEARISNSVRSAAWINASYHSGSDSLLSFGAEEGEGEAELCNGCQRWYLSSTGGSYVMYKGNNSKTAGTVTVGDGGEQIWRADENATYNLSFPADTWTGRITLDASSSDTTVRVWVGEWNGSQFTPSAAGENATIAGSGDFSISAGEFNVPKDEWLAFRIQDYDADGNSSVVSVGLSSSYLTSGATDPAYPIPELPAMVLFLVGVLLLAGYMRATKKKE